jgi:two-component system heavy metal sensor histidine kinase CusS
MFSKGDKPGTRPLLGSVGAWSLTTRLTVLYTCSVFTVLAVTGGYLYLTLEQYLKRKDSLAVRDQIVLLNHMLGEITDPQIPLSKARKWEERGVDNRRFQSRILDAELRVLAESPKMEPDALAFHQPVEMRGLPHVGIDWVAPSGNKYVLMSVWSKSGRAPDRPKIIQVAFERTTSMELLADFSGRLIGALLIGSLLAAVVAYGVARRVMTPLRDVAAAAGRISASQLHERLEHANWPPEIKELGTAFDGMLQRLQDSFGRLSQFSSDLAHELRTPIQNLMGEAEVALSRARSAEDYRTVIESGQEEYQRLSRMIDSLLFLARADAPQTHIAPVALDIRKELQSIIEFYEALAEERGVSLSADGNARAQADPILFRRAVSNLVSNGLRHTPPGGRVRVSVREAAGPVTEVLVSDTGTGISAQDLPWIFDRFYRADVARSNYSEGTGLGLAIVKSIMGLHNGSVSASSVSGQGTTIALRFPLAQPIDTSRTVRTAAAA